MVKILLLLALLCCCGCSPVITENKEALKTFANREHSIAYNPAHYPVQIDNLNSKNAFETGSYSKPPKRVVAVWQNSIETLLALGVGDRIIAGIGVPNKKYLRPEYQATYEKIPFTGRETLDLETIRMLDPDLIVGWYSTFSSKVLRSTDFWHARGINTYIAPASAGPKHTRNIEGECQDIINMGRIFDKTAQAEKIVEEMNREISYVLKQTRSIPVRPKGIIIEYMGREIRVYNEKTLAGNIFLTLKGELLGQGMQSIGQEELVALNPDVIFMVITETSYGDEQAILDRLRNNPVLGHLPCVQKGRLHPLPLYAIYSAGVRTYDGIKIMAQGLYPELYKE